MSTNNTSKIVIRLKRVTNNTTSKGTWFKKVINIGKYIGIVIAFLVSITTLYQFTDSFYQKKQNDDTEKLKKFVEAGRKVYYSKAKYDYIAHYPEWPKSFSDKLTEIGLKQDYEQKITIQNLNIIQIHFFNLLNHLHEILNKMSIKSGKKKIMKD